MSEGMTLKITKKARAMAKAQQTILPKLIGNEVVNFALDNFQKQGYQGDVFEPWKKRKPVYKKPNTRAILTKSGRGRRSIHVTQANADVVAVGSPVPHMKAHNEGSTALVTVKEHTRKVMGVAKVGTGRYSVKTRKERMRSETFLKGHTRVKQHSRRMRLPKRQFIGKSQYLMNRLKRVYAAEMIKAFNT